MELLVDTIRKEVPTLNKNNIRLHVIGNTALLTGKHDGCLEGSHPGNQREIPG